MIDINWQHKINGETHLTNCYQLMFDGKACVARRGGPDLHLGIGYRAEQDFDVHTDKMKITLEFGKTQLNITMYDWKK